MIDCERVTHTVDQASPGQLILGFIRNHVKQRMKNKLVSGIPWLSLLQFLSPGFCIVPVLTSLSGRFCHGSRSQIKLFLFELLWS